MRLVTEDLAAAPETDAQPRARVRLASPDPIVRAGVERLLEPVADVVQEHPGAAPPDVVLAVLDTVDQSAVALVRSVPARTRVLLVVTRLDAEGLALAVRLGVLGVLARHRLDQERLDAAVTAVANGEAVYPPDLLGALLGRAADATRPAPALLTVLRVSERERMVLRHLADGADTREIARSLSYSERTVKSVIQDITQRFGVRNRPQVVAYALRHGLI